MKTRAYDPIEKRWRTDYVVTPNGDIHRTVERMGFHIIAERVDWKLSRFTGILDKNGNEIYEFDIIKVNALRDIAIGVVEFIGSSFQFKIEVDFGSPYRELGIGWYGVEILGDIFTTPELLEEVNR